MHRLGCSHEALQMYPTEDEYYEGGEEAYEEGYDDGSAPADGYGNGYGASPADYDANFEPVQAVHYRAASPIIEYRVSWTM